MTTCARDWLLISVGQIAFGAAYALVRGWLTAPRIEKSAPSIKLVRERRH